MPGHRPTQNTSASGESSDAANPVTVTLGNYSVIFSDVLLEEDVPLLKSDGVKGTVHLYHVPADSTVSIRNDSDLSEFLTLYGVREEELRREW